MTYSFSQLVGLAEQAGFPSAESHTAAAVALAESSGNEVATHTNRNGSTDYGLWQINSVHRDLLAGKNWRDPATNAQLAYAVWKGSGWRAWTTYNSGAYRQHLDAQPVEGATGGTFAGGVSGEGTLTGGVPNPFSAVTAALDGIGQSLQGVSALAGTLQRLTLPQTWVRIMAGIFGVGLVGFGVVILTREVRH